MQSSLQLRRQDQVHISSPNGGEGLKSWNIDNPWAGAYTKTFMRDSRGSMDLHSNAASEKPYTVLSKLVAEFIGVLFFVFIGSMSGLKSSDENVTTHAAFAHGLTIFVMVASLGHISGGHFNPAVTVSVTCAGKLHPILAIPYVIAQLLGGFVGALLVRAATSQTEYDSIGGGATLLAKGDLWHQGLIVEVILTAILTQAVLNTAVDTSDNMLAPLAIGMSVALDVFGAGSISGASMNPARSLGPCAAAALFGTGQDKSILWKYHYIYWAGPIGGAIVSAITYRLLFARGHTRLLP
ncbi:major intrinsic protein domain-containing protein [Ditylenchus destructor]|uniref:Major intrinsic protein domain-containing protein n=1 Tax=Ditylenchus destructor TaxID=166010 RepID=A0AAD4N8F2_9BILA|nr:major intrinsic protein domain-containing protein [Ditylenchus destructor]